MNGHYAPSELWEFKATACYKHRAPNGASGLHYVLAFRKASASPRD